jgi:hypothetical protein
MARKIGELAVPNNVSEAESNLRELTEKFNEKGEDFQKMVAAIKKANGQETQIVPDIYDLWVWCLLKNGDTSDIGRDTFYANPPVLGTVVSERILFTGTNVHLREFSASLQNDKRYRYCSDIGDFWDAFFGAERFINSIGKLSVPCLIIGTGEMRNHPAMGGETLWVERRLENIAEIWRVPFICRRTINDTILKATLAKL